MKERAVPRTETGDMSWAVLGRGGLFSLSEIINILSGGISDSFLFDPFKIPTISQLETRAQRPKVRRAAQEKKAMAATHKGPVVLFFTASSYDFY